MRTTGPRFSDRQLLLGCRTYITSLYNSHFTNFCLTRYRKFTQRTFGGTIYRSHHGILTRQTTSCHHYPLQPRSSVTLLRSTSNVPYFHKTVCLLSNARRRTDQTRNAHWRPAGTPSCQHCSNQLRHYQKFLRRSSYPRRSNTLLTTAVSIQTRL